MDEREKISSENNQQDLVPEGPWILKRDEEKCALCEVCAHCCPTGALRTEQREDSVCILFRPDLCDGCGKCLEHCPEQAGKLVRVDSPLGDIKEIVLAKSKLLLCAVCGSHFAPQSKVEAILRREGEKGEDVEIVRDYCSLCRRTQMVANFIEERRKEAKGGKAEYRTGKKWSWKAVEPGSSEGPPCPEVLDSGADQDPSTP